jgi:hypothetical protein
VDTTPRSSRRLGRVFEVHSIRVIRARLEEHIPPRDNLLRTIRSCRHHRERERTRRPLVPACKRPTRRVKVSRSELSLTRRQYSARQRRFHRSAGRSNLLWVSEPSQKRHPCRVIEDPRVALPIRYTTHCARAPPLILQFVEPSRLHCAEGQIPSCYTPL